MMAHGMDVKADGPAKRKADETGSTGTKRVRLQNAGGETSSAAYYQRLSRYVCILGLPAEVWQRVFTFCHPRTLASCMLISKPFRFCLTEVRDEASAAARVPSKGLKMMPSDEVWRASRYLYHSSMPRKNLCQTELATWRLLRGNKCQFCGYTTLGKTPDRRGNEAGPGKDQVGIVWPFAVRCCGQCINSKTQPVS